MNEIQEKTMGELNQINTRLSRVELEVDNLIGIKKWVMSILFVFVIQLIGFFYGYGGMSTQLDTVTVAVQVASKDRFYRTEAVAMELNLRREITRLENQLHKLERELDSLKND